MGAKFSDVEGSLVYVEGDLDVYSVGETLKQGRHLILANKSVDTIDFSRVEKIDSAGLAFVIELLKVAKKNKQTLHFQNIPARMHAVADIYGLTKILPERVFQAS